jgi:catechol 2,3-dioxygenase-like lactoylglutathione lyase family enzyme
MKRLHVHVSVKDLAASMRFYRTLFGAEPVVTQPDYAKWMLDDPRVNFAISMNRQPVGVNHLGFQVESDEELRGMRTQLEAADARMYGEDTAVFNHGESTTPVEAPSAGCCVPAQRAQPAGCCAK